MRLISFSSLFIVLFSLSFWYFYYIIFRRFCQGVFEIFFARGAGNQYQPLGFMRFQSLGLPSHSFLSFQSLREPYPAITSRVFVFLYAFNVLFICLISLSRGFCSPLFLYLLYHKFPDLSIVFSKKNKNFFYLFGTDCRTSFSCSYFQKLFELPKSGKFRGRAPVRGNRLEGSPALEQERAEVALPHVLFIAPAFVFIFLFHQSIGSHFYCQVSFPLH